MQNKFIVTPYFLDKNIPQLETLIQSGSIINKPVLPVTEKQVRISVIHDKLAEIVANSFDDGYRPISIAGDCCTAIGVLAGLQRGGVNPTFIWFDAHGDFNTWETTPSGFLGGMPLAMIVGHGEQTLIRSVGLEPLSEERIILSDARDLDSGERELVENSRILHLQNIMDLLDCTLEERDLYVHFDTDIVNPLEAPAMNYRATGGPSSFEIMGVFRYLSDTAKVIAVSMSSWNPDFDTDGKSQEVCMQLLNALIDNDKYE